MATRTPAEVDALGLLDWRYLNHALRARFTLPTYREAAALVADIAAAAEAADHHPEVTLAYDRVDVQLYSHDVGAVTDRDIRLARTVSARAADRGATPQPHRLRALELAIDTHDAARIRPFWVAILDGRPVGADPGGIVTDDGVRLWFQDSPPRPGRGRVHVDVYVPSEQAPARVRAAVDAGGRLVSSAFAPSWWVVVDADGNEACVCTWQDPPPDE